MNAFPTVLQLDATSTRGFEAPISRHAFMSGDAEGANRPDVNGCRRAWLLGPRFGHIPRRLDSGLPRWGRCHGLIGRELTRLGHVDFCPALGYRLRERVRTLLVEL